MGDCIGDDAELSALATRMNEPDRGRLWIDNVNSAAVGNVNAQRDAALICNETVAPGEMFVGLDRCIDNCNLIPVNLLSRE